MYEGSVTVLENKRIADGTFSLTFATEGEVKVRCGQFCMIGTGSPLRRPIAVCKAEGERITLCYRVRGRGTQALSLVRAGERLSALLPLGNGFFISEEEKRVALVGGGVGIFPLLSALRTYGGEKDVRAYMGFRTRSDVCMRYDVGRANKLVLATDDGSEGYRGSAVQAFMEEVGIFRPDVVLACGPLAMLRALKSAVAGKNFPVYVSLEERMGCGIGACLVCVCDLTDGRHARVCRDGPVFEIGDVVL